MSDNFLAALIVGLSVLIGYLWHLADALDLPVAPLAVLAELLLLTWLARRLSRSGGDR